MRLGWPPTSQHVLHDFFGKLFSGCSQILVYWWELPRRWAYVFIHCLIFFGRFTLTHITVRCLVNHLPAVGTLALARVAGAIAAAHAIVRRV